MEPRAVLRGFGSRVPASNRAYFDFEPAVLFNRDDCPMRACSSGRCCSRSDPRRRSEHASSGCPLAICLGYGYIPKGSWHPRPSQADAGALGLAARRSRARHRPAQAFDWKPTDAQALPDGPVSGVASEQIRLVPYGCTKFRISMFPVTPKAWAGRWNAISLESVPEDADAGHGRFSRGHRRHWPVGASASSGTAPQAAFPARHAGDPFQSSVQGPGLRARPRSGRPAGQASSDTRRARRICRYARPRILAGPPHCTHLQGAPRSVSHRDRSRRFRPAVTCRLLLVNGPRFFRNRRKSPFAPRKFR